MRATQKICRWSIGLCLAAAIPAVGTGQGRDPDEGVGGPLTGPPVLNAPFSADAITTVRLTLPDGTRLDQHTTARYYRDKAGRARVELKLESVESPRSASARHIRTVVATEGQDGVFTLDPETRTTRYLGRSWLAYAAGGSTAAGGHRPTASGNVGHTFAVPIRGDGKDMPFRFLMFRRAQDFLPSGTATLALDVRDELLGNRRIANVETTGRRVTMTLPAGALRNDKPFDLVDERWESPELKVLVSAHITDSRIGDVDYRLTNIRRDEPPGDLFVVPPDYAIDTTATPRDLWIAWIYADRYPAVGEAYAHTLGPR